MQGSLSDSPLLRFTVVMMAGIAMGRRIGSLVVSVCLYVHGEMPHETWMGHSSFWGIVVLVLLLIGVLVRRWERIASVVVLVMAFSLGVFLIQHSDESFSRRMGHHDAVAAGASRDGGFVESLQQWMDGARASLSRVYADEGLQGDDYGVVAAMTLGEKEHVSDVMRDVYSVSGAAHVFALSGMHLGIIFMLLAYVLPVSRYPKSCTAVQIVALWTYVMLVGYHASVIRAAVMLSVYAFGRILTRRPDSITVLIFTVSLLLVIAPQWLFNVGFQMSFMAVLSICLCYGKMVRMPFPEYRGMEIGQPSLLRTASRKAGEWIWGMFALSLAAQMGVAPLVAHYFGRFSCYSLFTNFVVSPAALLIISLALLLLVCAAMAAVLPWLGFLATGVAMVLEGVVRLQNAFLIMVTKMPYASVEGIRLNVIQTILVYVVIFCLWRLVLILYCRYGAGRRF